MNSTTTLAERLVLMRTKRGLSQEMLAEQAGLAQQSYSSLERGLAKGTTRIATLAHLLGVNAYWLETGLGKQDDADGLSPEERMMVDAMRQMKPAQRKGFMAFVAPGISK